MDAVAGCLWLRWPGAGVVQDMGAVSRRAIGITNARLEYWYSNGSPWKVPVLADGGTSTLDLVLLVLHDRGHARVPCSVTDFSNFP